MSVQLAASARRKQFSPTIENRIPITGGVYYRNSVNLEEMYKAREREREIGTIGDDDSWPDSRNSLPQTGVINALLCSHEFIISRYGKQHLQIFAYAM